MSPEETAATALAYRDSSAVVMHKHRDQARTVLDALKAAGFAVVPAAKWESYKQYYDDTAIYVSKSYRGIS